MVVTEAEAFEILILHICCCITSILSVDSSSITADLEFSTADSDSTSHGHDSHAWCLNYSSSCQEANSISVTFHRCQPYRESVLQRVEIKTGHMHA